MQKKDTNKTFTIGNVKGEKSVATAAIINKHITLDFYDKVCLSLYSLCYVYVMLVYLTYTIQPYIHDILLYRVYLVYVHRTTYYIHLFVSNIESL